MQSAKAKEERPNKPKKAMSAYMLWLAENRKVGMGTARGVDLARQTVSDPAAFPVLFVLCRR